MMSLSLYNLAEPYTMGNTVRSYSVGGTVYLAVRICQSIWKNIHAYMLSKATFVWRCKFATYWRHVETVKHIMLPNQDSIMQKVI